MHNSEKGDRYVKYHENETPKYAEMGYERSREDDRRVGGRLNDMEKEKREEERGKAKRVIRGVVLTALLVAGVALAGKFDAEVNAPFTERDQVEGSDDEIQTNQSAIELPEDDSNIEVNPDDLAIPPVPVSPSPNNTELNESEAPQE